jgi:hypothetical protein
MSVYSITYEQRVDDYGVVTLLTNAPLTVGQDIIIAGCGHGLDGSHVIYALPSYLVIGVNNLGQVLVDENFLIPNQVVFFDSGPDVARVAVTGATLTTGTWLGIAVATVDETAFLELCAQAANAFCYRRRQEAGYDDALATPPSNDVKLGTIMYGGAMYRQRGSIDQFASFDAMSTAQIVGLSPIIKQLLGIDRPQVA